MTSFWAVLFQSTTSFWAASKDLIPVYDVFLNSFKDLIEERGAYHSIMAELYATDIPGFTNYMRMTPESFEMIKTRLKPCVARQATNYTTAISVGEKLALTIRYMATGESYTSLSCQFRVGRSTISKFLPEVCRAIQDEFTREYLRCPTTPDEWKELGR